MKHEVNVTRTIELEILDTHYNGVAICHIKWSDQENHSSFVAGFYPDLKTKLEGLRVPSEIRNALEHTTNLLPEKGKWVPIFVKPEFCTQYVEFNGVNSEMQDLMYNEFDYGGKVPEDAKLIFVDTTSFAVLDFVGKPITQKVSALLSSEYHDIDRVKELEKEQGTIFEVDWENGYDMLGMGKCYPCFVNTTFDQWLEIMVDDNNSFIESLFPVKEFQLGA